jgi:hypothetical protein
MLVKIRSYGALTSAFLITLSTGSALATGAAQAADATCDCPPKVVHHTTAARPAPARTVRKTNADAEAYAQSFYDYNAARPVSEVVVHRQQASLQEQPWQVAPNDASIRFNTSDVGMAPPPRQPIALNDNDEWNGGVGYTMGARPGDGGGYGGQVHLYTGAVGQNGPTYNSYDGSFSTGGFAEGSHNTEVSPIFNNTVPTGPRPGY